MLLDIHLRLGEEDKELRKKQNYKLWLSELEQFSPIICPDVLLGMFSE